MSKEYKNKEYAKAKFEEWIHNTVNSWVHEYTGWDDWLEDDNEEFNEEDWEYIKNNLRFEVTLKEVGMTTVEKCPHQSNYDDVIEFHRKFNFSVADKPVMSTKKILRDRALFLYEEWSEFCDAADLIQHYNHGKMDLIIDETVPDSQDQDVLGQVDALLDLVYVAMGTAVRMGLPWQELWDDVQRANMSKERDVNDKRNGFDEDCIKPKGWQGPMTQNILTEAGYKPKDEGE